VETVVDERTATEIGAQGLEVLPLEVRRRIAGLWEAAEAEAERQGFTLDVVKDALLTLFQGRISLITNDGQLLVGRQAARDLIATMIQGAQERGQHVLAEFFLNEALFKLPRRFPLTD
jgi:hypothetical protein